jgi:type II secretory pathway pseudopilin PulG
MKRSGRGFTVAEVLTVVVIVGLILSVVAMIVPLLLKAPPQVQAQVDSVDSAALALYRVQRDVRQSDTKGIFNCTIAPTVSCAQPQGQPTTTPALLVATANPNGQFQSDKYGNPNWQGFIVFWLVPNSDGTSNSLERGFYAAPINFADPPGTLQQAIAALTFELTDPNAMTLSQDVQSLSASIDPFSSIVALKLVGGNVKGDVTSLSLTSNSYVRN